MNIFKKTIAFVTTVCFLSSTSFGQTKNLVRQTEDLKGKFTKTLSKAEAKGHVFQNSKGEKISAADVLSGQYDKVYITPKNETRFKYLVTMDAKSQTGTMSAIKADGARLGRVTIKINSALTANQNILNLQQAENSLNLMVQNAFASHKIPKSESRLPASSSRDSAIANLVFLAILLAGSVAIVVYMAKLDKTLGLASGVMLGILDGLLLYSAKDMGLVDDAFCGC